MKNTDNPLGHETPETPGTDTDFPGKANNPAVSKSIPATSLEIVQPAHGSIFSPCGTGQAMVPASNVTCRATVSLGSKTAPATAIQWKSSIEGSLGSGSGVSACLSTFGVHTISATWLRPGKPPLTATVNVCIGHPTDNTDYAGDDTSS